ncbi:BTB/POZ domain-containing protein 2 isoform X2 [Drosophila obscura]|uniref:BTB/POZ domain-containing protein 2 isoform X2 n=1 Tax=Drosophila obscura TaxID=7282 RepID=UPI001BB2ACAF|nr:BTB/POZ domain-containing protein 2 isoform X2 [Drosophila obscura]
MEKMNAWLRISIEDLGLSNRHTDCSFIIQTATERRVFLCHKLIFCCASEAFDRMLYGDFKESTTGEVMLKDVEPDIFEKFRGYLYGYQSEKLEDYGTDTLIKLCVFGNKFLVESIKEDCVKEMTNRRCRLGMSDLMLLFQCAHTLNIKSITKRVVSKISPFLKEPFNQSVVFDFDREVFKSYIETIDMKLLEADRFILIETYLKHNGLDTPSAAVAAPTAIDAIEEEIQENNREYISQLLGLIKFRRFTPKQFYEGPGKSSLLTTQQKYEHLYTIANECARAKDVVKSTSVETLATASLISELTSFPYYRAAHCHCRSTHFPFSADLSE